MGCEGCYTFGDTDTSYFREQAEDVAERLDADVAFSIVAVDDTARCEEAADELPVEDRETFLENCRSAGTSLSYEASGQELIILHTDHAFLRDEPAALRGLIAHELMHTVQRERGVGEQVEAAAKAEQERMIDELAAAGLSKAEIERFIDTVFRAAIYTLKDLLTNRELVDRGFVDELEAYYHHMLGVDDFCPMPDFYGEEADVAEVQDAIAFELGLLPAWLPFKELDREEGRVIRERLRECYEQDIPAVTNYVHSLEDLYEAERDDPDAFMEDFMREAVKRSIYAMTGKTEGQDGD